MDAYNSLICKKISAIHFKMGDVEKSEPRLLEHFGIIVNPSRMDVNSAFSRNLDISDGLFQIANGRWRKRVVEPDRMQMIAKDLIPSVE